MNKYIAEFLGAFTLSLIVTFAVANNYPIFTPVLAALVLGTFVYTIGNISGSHINPAVTLGLWSVGKIQNKDTVFYILAQVLGGLLAGFVVHNIFAIVPMSVPAFGVKFLIAEIFGATLFTFGIASIVFGEHNKDYSGLVVGTSLLLGITISVFMSSLGILNPAVAISLADYNLAYLVGPIIGSVIGFNLYNYILNTK